MASSAAMTHQQRSPWRPMTVTEGGRRTKKGRCFACQRYLNVGSGPAVELERLDEAVSIGSVTLQPGWYCPRCLQRSLRTTED